MPLRIEGGDVHAPDYSSAVAHTYAAAQQAQAQMEAIGAQRAEHANRLAFEEQKWQDEPGREASRQQRAANLEMQAYAGKLSMQEQVEMQRKENQIGAIRTAVANNQLTQGEADNEILRLQSGLDRDRMRQQRDHERQVTESHNAQMAEHRHRLAMYRAQEVLDAKNPEDRMRQTFDPTMMEQERTRLRGMLSPEHRELHDTARNAPYVASPEARGISDTVEAQARLATARRGGQATFYNSSPGHWTPMEGQAARNEHLSRLRATWTHEAATEHPISEVLRDQSRSSTAATAQRAKDEIADIEKRRADHVRRQEDSHWGGPVDLPPIFRNDTPRPTPRPSPAPAAANRGWSAPPPQGQINLTGPGGAIERRGLVPALWERTLSVPGNAYSGIQNIPGNFLGRLQSIDLGLFGGTENR
jgi:hypothetical protein